MFGIREKKKLPGKRIINYRSYYLLRNFKSRKFRDKTTLGLGANSQFKKVQGSVLYFSDAFRVQEWIKERGTPSAIFYGFGVGNKLLSTLTELLQDLPLC